MPKVSPEPPWAAAFTEQPIDLEIDPETAALLEQLDEADPGFHWSGEQEQPPGRD
jgi:hypothetical protein